MTTAGRKRSFDKDKALDKAMLVFWHNGFSGTSLSDLTAALGINRPSLYAAFGNKEQLFSASLNHYLTNYGSPLMQHLREPASLPLARRLESYLLATVECNSKNDSPKGCFLVQSCCESITANILGSSPSGKVDLGQSAEQALQSIFLIEEENNQLPKDLHAEEMTAYVLSLIYGLSVMARRGKSREALSTIVKTALKTLDL